MQPEPDDEHGSSLSRLVVLERRQRLAAAMRDLAHSLAAAEDTEAFDDLETTLRRVQQDLDATPRRQRQLPDFTELSSLRSAGLNGVDDALADRAVAGSANPTSIDVTTTRVGDEAHASVRFGPACEGAPGRVHGGLVAAVFDDLTGYALAVVQEPGFTGRLTVSYRKPVPVDVPITFRARIRAREDRKLHVEAEATDNSEVLATAEALFILVDRERFLAQQEGSPR